MTLAYRVATTRILQTIHVNVFHCLYTSTARLSTSFTKVSRHMNGEGFNIAGSTVRILDSTILNWLLLIVLKVLLYTV